MAERKQWWEILRDQFASRGLLDPESERIQEAVSATPAVKRQARGLLSLDPQAESDAVLEMGLGSLPGVGQAMALRDLERARRAKDPAAAAMAASNFIPFGTLLNRFRRGPISELDVYHGTPHRFPGTEANPLGEFDASKIGTGEGAQVYGRGIYLAESPGVATSYRNTLSTTSGPDNDVVNAYVKAAGGDRQKAAQAFRDYIGFDTKGPFALSEEDLFRAQKTIDAITNPPGSLYKADLPDEMIDRMLEWEKPLSEQSEFVKAAIRAMPNAPDESKWKNWTGEYLYRQLMWRDMTEPFEKSLKVIASEKLQNSGIPGIKYADAGSRGQSATGTRNFVVFPGEEKKVKILERK